MDKGLKKFTAHGVKPPFSDPAERQKAYREVFSTGYGPKVLQDLLSASGFYKPFIPNSNKADNASQAMFDQGKKYVCYEILNLLTIKLQEVDMTEQLESYSDTPLGLGDETW